MAPKRRTRLTIQQKRAIINEALWSLIIYFLRKCKPQYSVTHTDVDYCGLPMKLLLILCNIYATGGAYERIGVEFVPLNFK